MKKTLKAGPDGAGMRLDAWLAKRLPDVSRSRIQKWIKAGAVLRNGKKETPHAMLEEDDRVTVDAPDEPEAGAPLAPRHDIRVEIVHEDATFVVVNKPAGLLVHPAVPGETETLANALIAKYPEIASVGDSPERPGIVHRLDKEASGLLVVARTPKSFQCLKEQFQAHVVKKEYAVLVDGAVPDDSGTIRLAIGRSASGGKMAARPLRGTAGGRKGTEISDRPMAARPLRGTAGGRKGTEISDRPMAAGPVPGEDDREAITHYRVEERFPKATYLTVRTETGRTHQIRAHFHAIGCPVVGDPLYGTKKTGRLAAPRLFLHAKSLAFMHPVTDEQVSFDAPLPEALEDMLRRLRGK